MSPRQYIGILLGVLVASALIHGAWLYIKAEFRDIVIEECFRRDASP